MRLLNLCTSYLTVLSVIFAAEIPQGCIVQTTMGYRYSNFYSLGDVDGTVSVQFRVLAKSDAHLAFTASPVAQNPMYEIVIGASGNNFTDLRRTMTGRSIFAVRTPSVLSESEYRGFWLTIRNGSIEIGKESEKLPFFHWKDPEPLHVHYYALSSWSNTVAKWIHQCKFDGNSDGGSPPRQLPEETVGYNMVEKLRTRLMQTYSKDIRPAADHRSSFSVAVSMSMIHFDLVEQSASFAVHSWFRMSWIDERLKWNESDYDGLSVIHLYANLVWLPDIILYNTAEGHNVYSYAETPVRVYSDGSVIWMPPTAFVASCEFDLRRWPFDIQICTLRLGSCTHDGEKIELGIYNNATQVELVENVYRRNVRWQLLSSQVQLNWTSYELYPEQHPEVHFRFVVQRNSDALKVTVLVPAVVIVVLTLATLLLPNCWEKTVIALLDLFLTVLYLMHFNRILPVVEGATPCIVWFYSQTLVMIAVTVLLNVAAILVIRLPVVRELPCWISRFLYGRPGKFMGLDLRTPTDVNKCEREDAEHHGMDYISQINSEAELPVADGRKELLSVGVSSLNVIQREWLALICALDRLIFVTYLVAFSVMISQLY